MATSTREADPNVARPEPDQALPTGFALGAYEIRSVLSAGPTAIVYRATDQALAIDVALKEYFPKRLAQRLPEGRIALSGAAYAQAWQRGIETFSASARRMARLDHPALLRVTGLWEANGTVYRVMPYYPAARLFDLRRDLAAPPDEAAVRALLDALLGALEVYHRSGEAHGQVTPANILILPDDRPVLLDPSSVDSEFTSSLVESLMTTVAPSFAAPEQPAGAGRAATPASDLYSLAMVVRYCITGRLPRSAAGEVEIRGTLSDALRNEPPELAQAYGAGFVEAIDAALASFPGARPQTVQQFRERLAKASSDKAAPRATTTPVQKASAAPAPSKGKRAFVPGFVRASASEPSLDPAHAAPSQSVAKPVVEPYLDATEAPRSEAAPASPPSEAATEPDRAAAFPADLRPDRTPAEHPEVARLAQRFAARSAPRRRRLMVSIAAVAGLVVAAVLVATQGWQASPKIALDLPQGGARPTVGGPLSSAAPSVDPTLAAQASRQGPGTGSTVSETAPVESLRPESVQAPAPHVPPSGASAALPRTLDDVIETGEPAAARSADAAIVPPPPARPTAEVNDAARSEAALAAASAPRNEGADAAPVRSATSGRSGALAPTSPREACAARTTQFALYRCMQQQCGTRAWSTHPQCERLRATDAVE